MGCPLYLAMTAAEFQGAESLPERPAWMACHFSPNGRGLSNLPLKFPSNGMLTVNDQFPVQGHSPDAIAAELKSITSHYSISRVLLDFQRPGVKETQDIVDTVLSALPCPVGVSHHYAPSGVPVLLPPVPEDVDVDTYLKKYNNREIWLELSTVPLYLTVTTEGCKEVSEIALRHTTQHYASGLFCHYRMNVREERIDFMLYRTCQDNRLLCEQARQFGVTCAIGLYQEFQ